MRAKGLSCGVGRVLLAQPLWYGLALLVLVTGCATLDQRAGFSDVGAAVETRSGKRVVWNLGTELDAHAAEEVRALLVENALTVEEAVQVALLNNRDLQALYAELGVAQADLVQAGLLKNPVFDAGLHLLTTGGGPRPDLSAAMDFLDVFYRPLRRRVAAALFEDAKLRVTGAVLDFAATVRAAFYRHQAGEQRLELLQTVVQALAASFDVSQRLHAAGNITDLDLARERALFEEEKVQLRAAEVAARQTREQMNAVMGLWGEQTAWRIERRLPDLPTQPLPLDGLEAQALRQSLDLASARQRILVVGEQLGVTRATALVPEAFLGAGGELEGGEWAYGPEFSVPIPLFDQGQARIGLAAAELRRAQQEYYALGVRLRATARAVREGVQGAQDRALYYRDILLPLRERIVHDTQLQYNAMQIGVIDLLRAREQQMQAAIAYVDTLLDYWLARTELEQLLSGRVPSLDGFSTGRRARPRTMGENAGH
jgi:cobalt-zinc-cadmium efflux system outer membrane protein